MGSARPILVVYADARALAAETVAALVTDDDRERVTIGMHPRRSAEYLAGRAVLRYALARHTGGEPRSFRILVDAQGKPECAGGPAISVSHSGDLVACAVATQKPVGVDVETTVPRGSLAEIAERYFTPAEVLSLRADPERFRMLWVLKEAYLKALGVGLAGGLDALECAIEPPRIAASVAAGAAAPHLALLAGQDCYLGVAASVTFELAVHRFAPGMDEDRFGPLTLLARTANLTPATLRS